MSFHANTEKKIQSMSHVSRNKKYKQVQITYFVKAKREQQFTQFFRVDFVKKSNPVLLSLFRC